MILDIPCDRHGHFDPALIGKYQRRYSGFDTKISALYAHGMSTDPSPSSPSSCRESSLHSRSRVEDPGWQSASATDCWGACLG